MNTVKSIRDFAEAHAYLRQFHHASKGPYKLATMQALMEHLGNPQDQLKIVHVAGTSGKTSTAYYITAMLTTAGCKTGLTVSPHVDELNERIQLNGKPLSEDAFCRALQSFAAIIEDAPVTPSWFELVVAFAYWYFAQEKVDYAVVEVGLGGLLDGTNVVSRRDKVCVVTDIGYDHRDVLGNSLQEIAAQKFGIVTASNPIFMHEQDAVVMAVAARVSAEQGGELHVIRQSIDADVAMPQYQWRNWQLAREVYKYVAERDGLKMIDEATLNQTRLAHIPGRMEVIQYQRKTIVMDGAHNSQKMEAFMRSFRSLYPGVKPVVLIGMKNGKEYEEIVPQLAELASRVVCTSFETSQDVPIKSTNPQLLAEAFKAQGVAAVEANSNYRQAFNLAVNGKETVVLAIGSIYLLGQIRPLLT